jgi:hypothetical protein
MILEKKQNQYVCIIYIKRVDLYIKLAGNYNIIRQGLGLVFISMFLR